MHYMIGRHYLIVRYHCDAICSLMIKSLTKVLIIVRCPISISTGGKINTISKWIILSVIYQYILRSSIRMSDILSNLSWPLILCLISHISLRRHNNLLWLCYIVNWWLYWLMKYLRSVTVKFYYWIRLVLLFTYSFLILLGVVHFSGVYYQSVSQMLWRRILEFFLLRHEMLDYWLVNVLSLYVVYWTKAITRL